MCQDEDEQSILAMSAINELLYRKCVPPGTQSLFEVVYEHIEHLLKDILNPASSKVDCLTNE